MHIIPEQQRNMVSGGFGASAQVISHWTSPAGVTHEFRNAQQRVDFFKSIGQPYQPG